MPHGKKDVILIGVEGTPGTASSSMDLDQPFIDDGLIPSIRGNNAEVRASSTWPYQTDDVPIGASASLRLMPDVNINTVRDLILFIVSRTNGDIPFLTLQHTRAGVGHAQYLGCVCVELTMRYSRSGSPDGSSILTMELSFECMMPEATTGVSAGTPAVGRRFRIEKGTFTLNSVAATEVLEYTRTMRVTVDLGALDGDGKRLYITIGDLEESVNLTARFNSTAWTNLILGGTEHAAAIIHATGSANETVTETMGKVQLRSHELSKSEGTILQAIELRPFHTGAAAPTIWTFGSSIGASALSLS